jgi:hypothetical protein
MGNRTITRLDESNSKLFRAKPGSPKRAVLCWKPAEYHLEWGDQHFDGPHMLVLQEDEKYGVDLRVFFKTHRPVADQPDHYVKDALVRAVQVDAPTDLVTVVNGREEMRSTVQSGAWIVQNPDGELYYNEALKFEQAYEPAEDSSAP